MLGQDTGTTRIESRGRVLVVNTSPDLRDLLANASYEVEWLERPADLRTRRLDFDVALLDLDSSREEGALDACQHLTSAWPDTPVVVISDKNEFETVVGAMRSGAYDFIAKPVVANLLHRTVERAIRHRILRCRLKRLTEAVEIRDAEGIVGSSPGMRHLFELIARVADADTCVLVCGESGTGKELVARAIHHRGSRSDEPFVAINCGAMPAELLESELFGHVKGAFTSARNNRTGLFATAGRGTLMLDEIGEMPFEMQAKLLRVLQERTIRPVGGELEVPYEARVIAATNRDLEREVAAGRFREDLYYRINVVQIDVPALRERGNDILLLAEHFARAAAERLDRATPTFSNDCARKLLRYDWPGNVRELENAVERAVALSRSDEIGARDLPPSIAEFVGTSHGDESQPLTLPTLAELERTYINHVLEATQGNKTRAAEVLGLDRRTLYRRLEKISRGPASAAGTH